MKKETIIIPDVHGRDFWRDAIEDIKSGIDTIFLGDYVDPYPHEGIGKLEALNNFKEIVDLAKNYRNVHLLIGNHDCTYIWPEEEICECRKDYTNFSELWSLFKCNLNLFSLFYIKGTDLFTHAGVHTSWLNKLKYSDSIPRALAWLDNSALNDQNLHLLKDVSSLRGGMDKTGSCVWADIREFDLWPVNIEYRQIVGHTMQLEKKLTDGGFIWVPGQPKYVLPSNIVCLDCMKCFWLDEDGEICS